MKKDPIVDIVGLADIINSIKKELQVAYIQAKESGLKPNFLLRQMSIDISVVAEKSDDVDGKLDFKIVSVGGSNKIIDKAIHHVKLDFDIAENDQDERSYGR